MSTAKEALGTRTALSTTAMNSLASANYVNNGTITHASGGKVPLDCLIEVQATTGTVSSNKQLVVFAQVSPDGTNFSTGPVSGTTTTDEPNLYYLGVVPLNSNATVQSKTFSLRAALGFIPFATKIITKNESGAALAGSGHGVWYTDVTGDIV